MDCFRCEKPGHHFNVCLKCRALNLEEDILDKGEVFKDDDGEYDESKYARRMEIELVV